MSSSSEPADSTKSGEVSWVTVQFKEDVTESQIQNHHAHVSKLCEGPLAARSEAYHGHYGHLNHVFKGYTGQYPKAIIEEIKKSPEVSVVETSNKSKNWKDLTYKTIDKQDWTMSKISNLNPAFTTQESDGDFIYSYPADWGKGVIIFVLERKFKANDIPADRLTISPKYPPEDGTYDSHGTCVANMAGGNTIGAARGSHIYLINPGDYVSTTINALDELLAQASTIRATNPLAPLIVNCSFGDDDTTTSLLYQTYTKVSEANILIITAAGNENVNMSSLPNDLPAAHPDSVDVGGITRLDTKTTYSNYGDRIDIWAPGTDIPIIGPEGNGKISADKESGTSFACPIVAGCVATLLPWLVEKRGALLSPKDLREFLHAWARKSAPDLYDNKRGPILFNSDAAVGTNESWNAN